MNAMNPDIRTMDESELVRRLNIMLPPELVPHLVNVYRDSLSHEGNPATPADILGGVNTDLMFRIPTIRLVEAQRDNSARSYNYLFTYKSPAMGGMLGAMHGLDNPFLFGTLDIADTQFIENRFQVSAAKVAPNLKQGIRQQRQVEACRDFIQ